MPAQIHLERGSEPADSVSGTLWDEKCGLGEIVLLGDGEHLVGRDINCPIYLDSEYISTRHAQLTLSAEGIFSNSLGGSFNLADLLPPPNITLSKFIILESI